MPRRAAACRAAACATSRACAWQFFVTQSFSSLTRRIVSLNVAGLVALVIGILYLSQFRAGLIDARVQSLLVQGEIIAGAIAASATVETDSSITIDPDRLLELQTGESYGPDDSLSLEFPINPERVAPVLRRLVSPTKTRARIYDRDGLLLLDSRSLYGRGDVMRFDLPPPNFERPGWIERNWLKLRRWMQGRPAALPRARAGERKGLSGTGAGARRPERQHGARQRPRRGHRFGGGAGAALPRRARGADAVDPGRRDRPGGRGRAAADRHGVPDPARRHGGAVDAARAHHRGPGGAARRRRRARAPAHPLARRDSRLHQAPRRDRPPVRHAARHDQRALQPDRGDRELRRRRRARIEEPAHLVALGGGDPAARQDRGQPRPPARA